jgi:hypothetical protein
MSRYKRVINQLCLLEDQYIHMPTDQEMQETATRLEAKFHLPRFAFGIDGVVMTLMAHRVRFQQGL